MVRAESSKRSFPLERTGSLRRCQTTMLRSMVIWNVVHSLFASPWVITVGYCHFSWKKAPSLAAYMSPACTLFGSVSVPPSMPSA